MRPDELFSIFRPYFTPERRFDHLQNELVQEFVFWLLALLLMLVLLWLRPSFFQACESYVKRLSRKRGLAVAIVIMLALGIRIVLLLALPIPDPVYHDEYSYLFQAKTFASGRITNPTPSGWEHFEAFHVNMQPTYQSMYPPAQAMFMAGAEVLHAHPWWGVWLTVGLMCGAVCWMLQGWMPPHWAFLGGLFCVIRFSAFSYWMDSYFGGALPALGGALVLGSFPRLRRNPKVRYGILLVLGLIIMANTRMYEGFVLSFPILVALAFWFFPAWRRGQIKVATLAPAAVLLLLLGCAMGYYNWRSTGSPLRMPYMVNQAQYHITKPFIWQARYPIPEYRHQVMRNFYLLHELPDYVNRSAPDYYLTKERIRFEVYYDFFIWPLLIPTIFALWAMAKSGKMRILVLISLAMAAALSMEQWQPEAHYAAPILGIAVAVVLYGLRLLWTLQPKGIPLGPMLVRSVVILVCIQCVLATGEIVFNPYRLTKEPLELIPQLEGARLKAELDRIPGNHLVFVHFHRAEIGNVFWLYNDPDPARSKIIWAHDMGDVSNQELIRAYPNRQVWFVDKDSATNRLWPYPVSGAVAEALRTGFAMDPLIPVHEN